MEPTPRERLWSVIHDPATPAAVGAALADASVALDALADDATPEDLAAVDRARARLATTTRSVLSALAAGASITGDRVGAVGLVVAELALRPDDAADAREGRPT